MRLIHALVVVMVAGLFPFAAEALGPADFKNCTIEQPGTKERLDCFDMILPPARQARNTAAATIDDCRYKPEQDERLACFESFMSTRVPAGLPGRSARARSSPASTTRVNLSYRAASKPSRHVRSVGGSCSCSSGRVCVGPRGGRYCITSGGNKRYGR